MASYASADESNPCTARRLGPWLFGVALVGLVIAASFHATEARAFALLVEGAQPWWLAVGALLQCATYPAAGQVFREVARAGGASLSVSDAIRLTLAKLFIDLAVPTAGLSATVVLAKGLARCGLSTGVAAACVIVDLVSYQLAYVVGLVAALVIASRQGNGSWLLLVATGFLLFASSMSLLLLQVAGRPTPVLSGLLMKLPLVKTAAGFVARADRALVRRTSLVVRATAWQFVVVLCDAATVRVLVRALGARAPLAGIFGSFMLSCLLRTVGFIPGGLGTFEAASVFTLHLAGVPTAPALAATLLFRGLSLWLPMLPGLWYSRRALAGRA
jgi:uncharacterized membrane protein YbhN (UPF0104 family)